MRLPKEFRFDADTVRIRRRGSAVILEPIPKDWAWLDALPGPVDEDFAKAVLERPREPDRSPPEFPE